MPYKQTERQREYQRQWNALHRNEYQRKYRERKGRAPASAESLARQKAKYEATRKAIFDLLGDTCRRCGFSDQRALHIDHINGGGNDERRLLRSVSSVRKKILECGGEGYQILCANCNAIKLYENQEHRRRTI